MMQLLSMTMINNIEKMICMNLLIFLKEIYLKENLFKIRKILIQAKIFTIDINRLMVDQLEGQASPTM